MSLNNNIADVDQDLALVYKEAKAAWKRDKPQGPFPELNETYRAPAVQTAYFAQGREALALVNQLRARAGLDPISAEENKDRVTKAQASQSPHPWHYALDVRMRVLVAAKLGDEVVSTFNGQALTRGGIDWGGANGNKYYVQFGGYMIAAARRLLAAGKIKRNVRWGHDWNGNGVADESFTDDPHYEIKGWAGLVAAGIKARLA